MVLPKFQLGAFALASLGAMLIAISLFVITENSSIHWTSCSMKASGYDVSWRFGLQDSLAHDNSGNYQDETVSNCGDEMKQFSSFVDTKAVCESGKLMFGMGITAVALVGMGILVGVLAMCKKYGVRWMLATAGVFILASFFAGLGAGLYRDKMQKALPNVTSDQGSIQCSPEAGPIALTFIGMWDHSSTHGSTLNIQSAAHAGALFGLSLTSLFALIAFFVIIP
jgi:hypothetical protein